MEVGTLNEIVAYDFNRFTERFRQEAESEIWIDERLRGRLFPAYLAFCVKQKWLQMVSRN